ncbi:MAG: nucleotidyltransferase domain-containing protein [Nitrosotalea sp.]
MSSGSLHGKNVSVEGGLDFVTPTYMKVLNLFLSDPMQEYHEREVARKARVSSGSANKLLRLMASSKMLKSQRRGRMVLYRLDLDSPTAKQFKILANVNSLEGLLSKLKAISKRVVLFGSCSQGTDVKESDIDMMILTDESVTARKEITRFNSRAKRRIASIIVDANEFARLRRNDTPLYDNIERGIVLWEAR